MKNISLVGFGRIGRDLFRQTIKDDSINIVSVSDIAEKENLVYLLKYDSIYGPLNAEMLETENAKTIEMLKWLFLRNCFGTSRPSSRPQSVNAKG